MTSFKLKFMGTSNILGAKVNMYVLKGVNIGVSLSNKFVMEQNADANGKMVKTISFSNNNMPIPQDVLSYALNHFGVDTDKQYYVNMKSAYDPYDKKTLDIYYYEQLQDSEAEQ